MPIVLDSSAVLALLFGEPGAGQVEAMLPEAVISAVNLQEVFRKLIDGGAESAEAKMIVEPLELRVTNHDARAALGAAALHKATRKYGRGLGDRSCMALAIEMQVRVLTADREWKNIEIDGLDIELIR